MEYGWVGAVFLGDDNRKMRDLRVKIEYDIITAKIRTSEEV
jgi:hypothetical protein